MHKVGKRKLNQTSKPHRDLRQKPNLSEMLIGAQVKKLRKLQEIPMSALSKASGISVAMLSLIENNQRSYSVQTLSNLARALHVPVAFLLRKSKLTGLTRHRIRATDFRDGKLRSIYSYSAGTMIIKTYLLRTQRKLNSFSAHKFKGRSFVHMVKGNVLYRCGKEEFELQKGDSLLVRSNVPQGVRKALGLPLELLIVVAMLRTFSHCVHLAILANQEPLAGFF